MKLPPNPGYRHRFPVEIISYAVWLYHVFSLSLRDVELVLAERPRHLRDQVDDHGRAESGSTS